MGNGKEEWSGLYQVMSRMGSRSSKKKAPPSGCNASLSEQAHLLYSFGGVTARQRRE